MAWIKMIPYGDAEGELKEVLEPVQYSPGKVDHILLIHSLNPPSMPGHVNFYRTIMFGKSGLSRKERELIATSVSIANDCHY